MAWFARGFLVLRGSLPDRLARMPVGRLFRFGDDHNELSRRHHDFDDHRLHDLRNYDLRRPITLIAVSVGGLFHFRPSM